MSAEPYTDAELEAAAAALPTDPDDGTTVIGWQLERHASADPHDVPYEYHVPVWGGAEQVAAAVLRAVLPQHAARIRKRVAEELAEEIAETIDTVAHDVKVRYLADYRTAEGGDDGR